MTLFCALLLQAHLHLIEWPVKRKYKNQFKSACNLKITQLGLIQASVSHFFVQKTIWGMREIFTFESTLEYLSPSPKLLSQAILISFPGSSDRSFKQIGLHHQMKEQQIESSCLRFCDRLCLAETSNLENLFCSIFSVKSLHQGVNKPHKQ